MTPASPILSVTGDASTKGTNLEPRKKLLILEDSPDDAALIDKTLQRAQLLLEVKVVDKRQEFIDSLESFHPDVIISDHQLPQFSSNEALDICRKRFPFIPFILVTGAVSEEFAASIIKAGADDYVLKNSLKRLPTAVLQAIDKQHTLRLYQKSEASLHSIFDHTDTAYVLVDRFLTIQYFNHLFSKTAFQEVGAYPKEGDNMFTVINPARKELWERYLQKLLAGESLEFDMETVGPLRKWYHYRSNPVFNERKEVTGVMTAIRNITERKLAELQLQAAHKELADLIDNANAPIFGTDSKGKINEWNKFAERLTGYPKKEMLGKGLDFVKESDRPKVIFILGNVEMNEYITNLEVPILTRDGKELILLLNITPRKFPNIELTGFLMVGQNITEMTNYRSDLEAMVEKRTEELNNALKKEKELVDLKSRFVSVASHEFRTPLSTISFAAESIRKYFHQLSADDITQKLIKIEEQVSHMTNLLEDILTVGKSEAGKIKVKRVSLDLKEFMQNLIDEVTSTAKASQRIAFRFDSKFEKVSIDDKLFRNVFVNLLTNALKFSPSNTSVEVSLTDNQNLLVLNVADHGIGINQNELDSIFEAFHRGSNVSNVQGTGLGLSITKKAVDLMNGTIHVESILGKGTTFTVLIPVV